MAQVNSSVEEIAALAIESRRRKLANNTEENNALLAFLRKAGNVDPFSGGRTIYEEIDFDGNTTYKSYSGFEQLDVSPTEVFSVFEFSIKQAAASFSISGLQSLQVSGKEGLIDLVKARLTQTERTFMNGHSADIYSDGTGSSGKQIGGLQSLIADTPTSGTVGGIDRATYTWARNQFYRGVTDGGAAVSAANIVTYYNRLYASCVRGSDMPTLLVSDDTYFNFYEDAVQSIQRITSDKEGGYGFPMCYYKGHPHVLDGGYNGSAPSAHTYMIDTNAIRYRPHVRRNIVPLEPGKRFSTNQDAFTQLIAWAGNMTATRFITNGVLVA